MEAESVTRFTYYFAAFLLTATLASMAVLAVVLTATPASALIEARLECCPPVSIRDPRGPDLALPRTADLQAGSVAGSTQGVRYEITGYAHGCILPRSGQEGPPRRMASGKWPQAGLHIAADTSLHPFGTELHIEGVGLRTVGDRGYAIKGRRLDLFLDSCRDARAFGRRWLIVTRQATRAYADDIMGPR